MKRKVVKHGNSTLTISLPSKWVKANRINAGQILDIEQSAQSIFISLNKNYVEKTEISLSGDKEWYIQRILRHLYNYGYDEITIHYEIKEHLALIRKSLGSLTGFEIIESNPKKCKIECLSSFADTEYEGTIKRILWLILSELDYFVEDCEVRKPVMYEEVNEQFKTVSKLINLCRRLINKKSPYDAITSKYAYRFLTSLMNIASYVVYSYEYVKKSDKLQLSQQETELIKKVRDFYNQLLLAYQNLNAERTKQFFAERERMFDDVLELLKDKNPVITHYFLDILKELSSLGNLILILKINEEDKDMSRAITYRKVNS